MSHLLLDQRDLAMGFIVAERVRQNSGHIDRARMNIARWRTNAAAAVLPVLDEWDQLLRGPLQGVIDVLTTDDERCRRLRQSTPFTAMLSTTERNELILKFNPNDPKSA